MDKINPDYSSESKKSLVRGLLELWKLEVSHIFNLRILAILSFMSNYQLEIKEKLNKIDLGDKCLNED